MALGLGAADPEAAPDDVAAPVGPLNG